MKIYRSSRFCAFMTLVVVASSAFAAGVAPYKCVWGNGSFSYQDEPCGKSPAPSSRFYDANGRAIAYSTPVPAAPPPDRIVAPTSLPALCKTPRAKAEADLLAELTRRFPTSEDSRAELLRSNMRNFDAICATPGPPNVIQTIDELARMHYPYFTLIMDTMHSYARAAREARQ